jgi:hypothetical protein
MLTHWHEYHIRFDISNILRLVTNIHRTPDLVLGKLGRDKAGHVFLAEACRMSQELGLFSTPSSHPSQSPPSVPQEKWDSVRAVTAWAVFNFQL